MTNDKTESTPIIHVQTENSVILTAVNYVLAFLIKKPEQLMKIEIPAKINLGSHC